MTRHAAIEGDPQLFFRADIKRADQTIRQLLMLIDGQRNKDAVLLAENSAPARADENSAIEFGHANSEATAPARVARHQTPVAFSPTCQPSVLPHRPDIPGRIFGRGLDGGERQSRGRADELHGLRTQSVEATAARAHPKIAFRVLQNIDDVGMGRFHAFDALRIKSKEAA